MIDRASAPDEEQPNQVQPDLLLVGGSVRAAAFSLRRAGLQVMCFDRFADQDLVATAISHLVPDPVNDLPAALAPWSGVPVVYVGGLENHPETLAKIAENHPLWGNSVEILKRVRNPQVIYEILSNFRLPVLKVFDSASPPPNNGDYLLKPLDGSGGVGIVRWDETVIEHVTLTRPHYFQEFKPGQSYSAVFLAGECVGEVRFVGITQQLIGLPELGGENFTWCGNVGPAHLDIPTEHTVRRLGNMLKWKLELKGLFGIDFIVDEAGTPFLVEVNPRYTASVEILEWVLGESLLAEHCRWFAPDRFETFARFNPAAQHCLGKAIVYARRSLSDVRLNEPEPQPWLNWPNVADIPASGTIIPIGAPLCTVYASDEDTPACLQKLLQKAEETWLGVG